MKLNKLWILAAAALVGCAETENNLNVKFDGEQLVTLNISLPESKTRTDNESSAKGGYTNIDWAEYDLRYQIEIYDATGTTLAQPRITEILPTGGNFEKAVSLTVGRSYKVYAWADFVAEKEGENPQTDLHYNTADFEAITYKDGVKINDESADAYCGTGTIDDNNRNLTLSLARPLGKLRVVTNDAHLLSFEQYPDNVALSYTKAIPTGYNLKTGAVIADDDTYKPTAAAAMVAYGDETAADAARTLMSAYIFGGASTTVQFQLAVKDDTADIYTLTVGTDVPVVANKLTTLKGAMLTDTASVECSVTDEITGGETTYVQDSNGDWVEETPQP